MRRALSVGAGAGADGGGGAGAGAGGGAGRGAGAGVGLGAATCALRAAGGVQRPSFRAGAGVGLGADVDVDTGVATRLDAAGADAVRTVAGVRAGAARLGSRGGEEAAAAAGRAGRAASSEAFWKPPHNCGCRGAAATAATSGSSRRGVQPPSTRCDASRARSLASVACSGSREARWIGCAPESGHSAPAGTTRQPPRPSAGATVQYGASGAGSQRPCATPHRSCIARPPPSASASTAPEASALSARGSEQNPRTRTSSMLGSSRAIVERWRVLSESR